MYAASMRNPVLVQYMLEVPLILAWSKEPLICFICGISYQNSNQTLDVCKRNIIVDTVFYHMYNALVRCKIILRADT